MLAAATPERSLQQRLDALARGNEVRFKRADLKRDLKAGRADVSTLIVDPPEWLLTMKVYDLLVAAPKLGRVKTNNVLTQCRVSPAKTVGGLTVRQRGEVVLCLARGGIRPPRPRPVQVKPPTPAPRPITPIVDSGPIPYRGARANRFVYAGGVAVPVSGDETGNASPAISTNDSRGGITR